MTQLFQGLPIGAVGGIGGIGVAQQDWLLPAYLQQVALNQRLMAALAATGAFGGEVVGSGVATTTPGVAHAGFAGWDLMNGGAPIIGPQQRQRTPKKTTAGARTGGGGGRKRGRPGGGTNRIAGATPATAAAGRG
jgi:hypothetical protein